MCGIAGFYNADVDEPAIRQTIQALRHRGPDSQQFVRYADVALIHTRLSILDLSPLGSQPYTFEHLTLVFNGELYNFKEVRASLSHAGYHFISNSDTEVLIKAFHKWGPACIDRFIGMFAFAIYDKLNDELYIFRDRVGVKPLYYSADNRGFYFASELRALKFLKPQNEIDINAVADYFRFGFVAHPRSIYKGVAKLSPGHFIKITRTGLSIEKYWDDVGNVDNSKSENQWLDELEELMVSSFSYRMVSDVPVGVFLSGGIDSSLLTAILQRHFGNISTFTIGFGENKFNETPFAKSVANHLQTNHTEKILLLADARDYLNRFYDIYDEPFADTSGIPTACVTALAKAHGMKVVLSADGGDELFGGYTHYLKADRFYSNVASIPGRLRKSLATVSSGIFPKALRDKLQHFNLDHKLYAFDELIQAGDPASFFEAYVANQAHPELKNLLNGFEQPYSLKLDTTAKSSLEIMMRWDRNYFLADDLLTKVDRATMWHSIECREPLLDHRLIEFASTIPVKYKIANGKGKILLRKLLSRYLPEELFERPKQGFSIPVFSWFTSEFDQLFETHLSPESLKEVYPLNAQEVQRELSKYKMFKKQNKADNIEKMWRLLSFVMWWKSHQSA
jgi:asparagine synthase (glutamine-hydrolysing)